MADSSAVHKFGMGQEKKPSIVNLNLIPLGNLSGPSKNHFPKMEYVKNHTPYGFLLCQVQSNFGVSEYWSCELDLRRARETMWLQLMCCTLSNFSLSQFTRGWMKVAEQRERSQRQEGGRTKLIFKLKKYIEQLWFIYQSMWWSPGCQSSKLY